MARMSQLFPRISFMRVPFGLRPLLLGSELWRDPPSRPYPRCAGFLRTAPIHLVKTLAVLPSSLRFRRMIRPFSLWMSGPCNLADYYKT